MNKLAKIIITAINLTEKSGREGLLALNEDIDNLKDSDFNILKHGMKLALDGVDSDIIYRILNNIIEREKDKNEIKIKIIQREAIFGILAGYNTRILCFILFSYLEKNERRALEPVVLRDDVQLDIDDSEDIKIKPPDLIKAMNNSEFIKEAQIVIKKTYNFANKARREGLLMLEDEIEDLDDEFIKQGLRLVVDGTDYNIINTILTNQINAEKDENRKILKKMMKEAVLNIQMGNSPDFIIHKLISFLDNSKIKEISKLLCAMNIFKEDDFKNTNQLEKDKKKFTAQAANIIKRAYEFSEKSNEEKMSAIEKNAEKKEIRDIFEYGMKFATKGNDTEDIDFILSNLIEAEKNEEIRRLKMIQKDAVLCICDNENPALLLHTIISHIEDAELEEVKKLYSNSEFLNKFNKLLENPYYNKDTIEKMNKLYKAELEKSTGSKDVIDFFNRPLNLLEDTNREFLNKIIKREHPQVFAAVIARLSCGFFRVGGIEVIVNILKRFDQSSVKKIIKAWEEKDSELAEEVKQKLLTFDDFIMLDLKDIQKVIREVDSFDLAKALKSLEEEKQNKVFKSISMRAASMLKEDMEYMGPVRLSVIKEAQEKILSIVRQMNDKGEIKINRRME